MYRATRLCAAAVICQMAMLGGVLADGVETAGHVEQSSAELRTAEALQAARADPLTLRDFLLRMPKGADLHNHLDGAVHAETLIRAGAEDGLCVDPATEAFSKPQPAAAGTEPARACKAGSLPASDAFTDQALYNRLIDSFSMRGFVPSGGVTGHDHFFASFGKFSGTDPIHTGEFLDEVATRAATENEQYLELMETPTWHRLDTITDGLDWNPDLASLREELLAKGLANDVPAARAFWDQAESIRNARERCGTPEAAPGCGVKTKYIYQVFRNNPKPLVFAQALFGFELAAADPRVVAVNFVGAEDAQLSMADYAEQMRMVGFLRGLYPKVHVSLHAGELAPGLVPPEGLCCHVRLAVEVAKADRIGHGVDVMYEDRPEALLKEMAAKHVLVETNLTSNDLILGVSGKDHPFPRYRKAGIPVALSTDDEGVSRIDLTHEYERAVATYDLSYADLKQLVRNSLQYSFLPGASLWLDPSDYTAMSGKCAGDTAGAEQISEACRKFLDASEKAAEQWELERRFQAFEAGF